MRIMNSPSGIPDVDTKKIEWAEYFYAAYNYSEM